MQARASTLGSGTDFTRTDVAASQETHCAARCGPVSQGTPRPSSAPLLCRSLDLAVADPAGPVVVSSPTRSVHAELSTFWHHHAYPLLKRDFK